MTARDSFCRAGIFHACRNYRGFRLMTWGHSPKLAGQELLTRAEFERLPEWVRNGFQHTQSSRSDSATAIIRLYWKSGIEQLWVQRFVAQSGAVFEKGRTWIY